MGYRKKPVAWNEFMKWGLLSGLTCRTIFQFISAILQVPFLTPFFIFRCQWFQSFLMGFFSWTFSSILTLSWRNSLSYRNQSIDLQNRLVDWFLYDRDYVMKKELDDLLESWFVKVFLEYRGGKSEAYLEHCQTSKMELFVKIGNGY